MLGGRIRGVVIDFPGVAPGAGAFQASVWAAGGAFGGAAESGGTRGEDVVAAEVLGRTVRTRLLVKLALATLGGAAALAAAVGGAGGGRATAPDERLLVLFRGADDGG